jgi:hypothetical protein
MNVFQMQEIARQRNAEIARATEYAHHARNVKQPTRSRRSLRRSRVRGGHARAVQAGLTRGISHAFGYANRQG